MGRGVGAGVIVSSSSGSSIGGGAAGATINVPETVDEDPLVTAGTHRSRDVLLQVTFDDPPAPGRFPRLV